MCNKKRGGADMFRRGCLYIATVASEWRKQLDWSLLRTVLYVQARIIFEVSKFVDECAHSLATYADDVICYWRSSGVLKPLGPPAHVPV